MKNKVIYISSIISILLISCVSSKKNSFYTNSNNIDKKSMYTTYPTYKIETNYIDYNIDADLAKSNLEIEQNNQHIISNIENIIIENVPSNIPLLDMSEFKQDYGQDPSIASLNRKQTNLAIASTINNKKAFPLKKNTNTKIDIDENFIQVSHLKELTCFDRFTLNHLLTKNKLNKAEYKHKMQYMFAEIGLSNLLLFCIFIFSFLSTIRFIFNEIK